MLTCKVLAALLCYPDSAVIGNLAEMAAVLDAENTLPAAERRAVQALMDGLAAAPPFSAEAEYVRLFDTTRSLSLHLFEHIHGDSRDRGPAMSDLIEHYRARGLEIVADELPDYLPLFLEFLSLQPAAEARVLLGEVADIIALLGERLGQRGSRYAAVFQALQALAPRTDDRAALRAAVTAEAPDDTPTALDAAWAEAPVTFDSAAPTGPQSGCPAAAAVARFAPGAADRPKAR